MKNFLKNSLSVKPIEGYGEQKEDKVNKLPNNIEGAKYRGVRSWRDEVGGATVCCSGCDAILGFASLTADDSVRLFKHLLSVDDNINKEEDLFSKYSSTSFIGREFSRYAESQAVYTFIVCVKGNEDFGQSIYLRMINWNTRIALGWDGHLDSNYFNQCCNAVKVIFEERIDSGEVNNLEQKAVMDTADPMTWGNFRICCPPDKEVLHNLCEEKQLEAAVKIYLCLDEWNHFLSDLKKGSCVFLPSVNDAIVSIKLGKSSIGRAKLSIMKLG